MLGGLQADQGWPAAAEAMGPFRRLVAGQLYIFVHSLTYRRIMYLTYTVEKAESRYMTYNLTAQEQSVRKGNSSLSYPTFATRGLRITITHYRDALRAYIPRFSPYLYDLA